jgi:thiol-disulfide isomerase/thioredoxin
MKKLTNLAILYALIVITGPILTCPHDKNIDDTDSVITINTTDHHHNFLAKNQGASAVLYHMDNCYYCKKTKPMFTDLACDDRFDDIAFYSVNGPQVQAEKDIKSITNQEIDGYPTILFFNQGQVVDSQVGAAPQDVIIQKLYGMSSQPNKEKKHRKKKN